MSYVAPLKDMVFVMNELAGLEAISALPGCEDATPETAEAVLEENAKFCAEVVAPLNWAGDQHPSSWHDGTVTTILRGSSKDLSLNVVMPIKQADQAVQELEGLLGKPVGVLASLSNGYAGLSAFGFITKGPVSYKNPMATCQVTVEGII